MFEIIRKNVRKYKEEAREWFEVNGSKLFLFLGMIASSTLAFEGGFLVGRDRQAEPIVITMPASVCGSGIVNAEEEKTLEVPTSEKGSVDPALQNTGQSQNESCAFVGSKNSDKYHLPKCSWAKRIKPENRVCFASAADAESKGYKAGCVK